MGRLIVTYSQGAVLLRDLAVGVDWCSSALFLVHPDVDDRALGVLAHLGDVIALEPSDVVGVDSGPSVRVLDAVRSFDPDGIVTFSEDLLGLTVHLAATFGLRALSRDALPGLQDKAVQRTVLRRAGVDDLRTATVRSLEDWPDAVASVGLPLVLKPTRGAGSRDTVRVDSAKEGLRRLPALLGPVPHAPLVAEEYLVGVPSAPFGDYVSVESLVVDGSVHHLAVTGKMPQLHPFRETAQFFPSRLTPDEAREVLALSTRALEALGVDQSMTHTEIKLTARGPRLIEVNGRAGGYVNELYGRVLATDVVELVSRLACGERPPLPTATSAGAVHFQTFHQPPPGALALRAVEGSRAVSRDPRVSRLDRLVEPGTPIPADGRSFDLDLVCGRADDHADLVRVLHELGGRLTFVFATADGDSAFTGAQLGPDTEQVTASAGGRDEVRESSGDVVR